MIQEVIELQKKQQRLEDIKAGRCNKEFEEKAEAIITPATRSKAKAEAKAAIDSKIEEIAKLYD